MENHFHTLSVKDLFKELDTEKKGLTGKEAEKRLTTYGDNTIEDEKGVSLFFLFLCQFQNAFVYILTTAALISAFFGKWIDVYVILAIIILNAIVGFFQEYKAERAIESLKKMIVPTARVYRNGDLKEISAKKLVPGDIVTLAEGDRIPADIRFFEIRDMRIIEAPLTGESAPVSKSLEVLSLETSLADRKNMGYMGTFVAGGSGLGVVVATGNKTAFGQIAHDIKNVEKVKDHFEEKSATLAKQMGIFALCGAVIIFLLSLWRLGVGLKEIFEFSSALQEVVLFSISALVSGIPEGLPAILVIVLALGARRMANRNAIVRKLPATETLGVATHIITDKTGTLTQNTMTIREIFLPEEEDVLVTGDGWKIEGDFYQNDETISPLERVNLKKLLHISAICNNAYIAVDEKIKIIGDPTEGSLVVLANKAGLKDHIINSIEEKIDDYPFNSELKYRASLVNLLEEDNKRQIYVVGAPEVVLERSTKILTEEKGVVRLKNKQREKFLRHTAKMTNKAMRTLALAYKEVKTTKNEVHDQDIEKLVFVGVVGMIDPPRPEVATAISKAKEAGIRIIMTTGDHKGTAQAIAKEVGIDNYDKALTQSELEKLSDKDFKKALQKTSVFARLTPQMKLKIAETIQESKKAVVAMTGDGVNDAPALKKADIGIAMGIEGTDVAKEASSIILSDDNFASIINAIEEGRIVFRNTRQASAALISTNVAEDITIISSLIFLGGHLPILPTQILWLNLVDDSFAGAPLAVEPSHGEVLKEKPRDKDEGILTMEIVPMIILTAIVMTIVTLFAFKYYHQFSIEKARTAAFTVLGLTQVFRTLNMRDIKKSVFEIGFFRNKFLIISLILVLFLQVMVIRIPFFQNIFGFETISYWEIFILIAASSSIFWLGELYKKLRY